jgi:hypothetical protein
MGYWNETCILTNLPILFGSDVVALEAENIDEIYYCLEGMPFTPKLNVAIGKMGAYGNLENIGEVFQFNNKQISGFEYDDDDRFIAFCYKDIWAKIVNWCVNNNAMRNCWDDVIKLDSVTDKLEELASKVENTVYQKSERSFLKKHLYFVSRFLYRARAGFPENLQRGSQQLDVQCRKLLAQWTIDQANKIEQTLKENESNL